MAKPKQPEGFEVAGTRYEQHKDPIALITQAAKDYVSPDPARGFKVSLAGNRITVACHCYDIGLGEPRRRESQLDAMSKATDEYVRLLRKRCKEMGGGAVKMPEDKSQRGFDLQKVSLNDRWYIVYRRVYRCEDLIKNPED